MICKRPGGLTSCLHPAEDPVTWAGQE
jgi:hypothetical protein